MHTVRRKKRRSVKHQAMPSSNKTDQLSQLLRELCASDEENDMSDRNLSIMQEAEGSEQRTNTSADAFHHRPSQQSAIDLSSDSDIFSSIAPSVFYRLKPTRQPVEASRFRSRLRSFDPLSNDTQFANVMLQYVEIPDSAAVVIDALPSVELATNATWDNVGEVSAASSQHSTAGAGHNGNGFTEASSDSRHSSTQGGCQSVENFSTPPETLSETVDRRADHEDRNPGIVFAADSTFVDSFAASPELKRRRLDESYSEELVRLRTRLLEHPLLNESTANKLPAIVRKAIESHLGLAG